MQRSETEAILTEIEIIERLCSDPPKRLIITPILDPEQQIQPSSVDLRLGTEFQVVKKAKFEFLDLLKSQPEAEIDVSEYMENIHIPPDGKFILHPGEFALACTLEYMVLPNDLVGRLEGKSTWGRVGLQIHSTAGFVDPGFQGSLTYELQNVGSVPIPLFPGLPLSQICFYTATSTFIPYLKKKHSFYGGWPGLLPTFYYKRPEIATLREIHKTPFLTQIQKILRYLENEGKSEFAEEDLNGIKTKLRSFFNK